MLTNDEPEQLFVAPCPVLAATMVAPVVIIPPSEKTPPLVFVPDDVLPTMVASVRTTVPWLKMLHPRECVRTRSCRRSWCR